MKKEQWIQLLHKHKEEIIEQGIDLYRVGLDWDGAHYAVHLSEHGEVSIEGNYQLTHLQGYTYLQVISVNSNLKNVELDYNQILRDLEKNDEETYFLINSEYDNIRALLPLEYPELEDYLCELIFKHVAPEVIREYDKELVEELVNENAYTWAKEQWEYCVRLLSI